MVFKGVEGQKSLATSALDQDKTISSECLHVNDFEIRMKHKILIVLCDLCGCDVIAIFLNVENDNKGKIAAESKAIFQYSISPSLFCILLISTNDTPVSDGGVISMTIITSTWSSWSNS